MSNLNVMFDDNQESNATADTTAKRDDIFKSILELGMSQDFSSNFNLVEVMKTVGVHRPKNCFFRTNSKLQFPGYFLVDKEDMNDETYIVAPSVIKEIADHPTLRRMRLIGCANTHNTFFFWPLTLPAGGAKSNENYLRNLEIAARAEHTWISLEWDEVERKHKVFEAEDLNDEPKWPEDPLDVLLERAFK